MTEFVPYRNRLSVRNRIGRALWNTVYVLFFRFTPAWCCHGYRRFVLRLFGAKIGQGCKIHPRCRIWAPWNLEMGSLVALAADVDCYSVDKITLGSKVAVSQRAFLCTASHDIRSLERPLVHAPIRVQNHVWIAAEAFIGPGVQLEEGCVVAARGVVTRSVAAWVVVGGNPARVLKQRDISEDCGRRVEQAWH